MHQNFYFYNFSAILKSKSGFYGQIQIMNFGSVHQNSNFLPFMKFSIFEILIIWNHSFWNYQYLKLSMFKTLNFWNSQFFKILDFWNSQFSKSSTLHCPSVQNLTYQDTEALDGARWSCHKWDKFWLTLRSKLAVAAKFTCLICGSSVEPHAKY